jgi:hypothetical protein
MQRNGSQKGDVPQKTVEGGSVLILLEAVYATVEFSSSSSRNTRTDCGASMPTLV